MVQTKTQIETIDLTPTWEEQTAVCIAVIQGTVNESAKATAREELFRMARALDALQKERREAQAAAEPPAGSHYKT